MGCDIHIFTEYKTNGQWQLATPFIKTVNEESDNKFIREIYPHRNYELFSALADVRNENHIVPIDMPRGLPDDVCDDIFHEFKSWGMNAHSDSYVYVRELYEYRDNFKETVRKGYVHNDDIIAHKNGKEIVAWCGWTNAPNFSYYEWTTNHCPVDELIEEVEKFVYVVFGDMSKEYIKDNFRLVFWFDN